MSKNAFFKNLASHISKSQFDGPIVMLDSDSVPKNYFVNGSQLSNNKIRRVFFTCLAKFLKTYFDVLKVSLLKNVSEFQSMTLSSDWDHRRLKKEFLKNERPKKHNCIHNVNWTIHLFSISIIGVKQKLSRKTNW